MTETWVRECIDALQTTYGILVYHAEEAQCLDFDLEVRGGSLDISIEYGLRDEICLTLLWITDYVNREGLLGQLYRFALTLQQLCEGDGEAPEVDVTTRPDGETYLHLLMTYPLGDLGHAADRIHVLLNRLAGVDLTASALDMAFLQTQHPRLHALLQSEIETAKRQLTEYMDSAWRNRYKNKTTYRYRRIAQHPFGDSDLVYTNYDGSMMVGFGRGSYRAYVDYIGVSPVPFGDYHRGYSHNILSAPEGMLCWSRSLWDEAFEILSDLELRYGHIPICLSHTRDKVFLSVIDFWICIRAEDSAKNSSIILAEKRAIETRYEHLAKHVPEEYMQRGYNLKQLTPSQFENLCCDLLRELGYKHVHIRGKAEAPDGGVDIEAIEPIQSLLKGEERKWIFQCKQTKRSWGGNDMGMIPTLVSRFEADGYGIFCSDLLTPTTLDRLRSVDVDNIVIYDRNNIKYMLQDYPHIAVAYFPPLGD